MLSEYLVEKMLALNIIAKNDKEIYLYGLTEGFVIIQNILITLLIGFMFKNVLSTIIFLAAYIPLRSFAGGYHGSTPLRCFIYSICLILFIQIYFSCVHLTSYIYISLWFAAIAYLLRSAPIQSVNKPLTHKEIIYCKKYIRMILIADCIIFFISIYLRKPFVANGLFMALMAEVILIIIAKCNIKKDSNVL